MKPDVLIRRAGVIALAADCKYKRLESDEFKNHDVYQLLAYCTATNTHRGLLVYPLHLRNTSDEVSIKNTDTSIHQISIDIGRELNDLFRECDFFADKVFACAEA
jgi:5-methylcytosine-specific restriction enzyme subunit McrC